MSVQKRIAGNGQVDGSILLRWSLRASVCGLLSGTVLGCVALLS